MLESGCFLQHFFYPLPLQDRVVEKLDIIGLGGLFAVGTVVLVGNMHCDAGEVVAVTARESADLAAEVLEADGAGGQFVEAVGWCGWCAI